MTKTRRPHARQGRRGSDRDGEMFTRPPTLFAFQCALVVGVYRARRIAAGSLMLLGPAERIGRGARRRHYGMRPRA